MRRAPLTLLLGLASCQDYKLHPDEDRPADSGDHPSWEVPGDPGGHLPPGGQVPVDTSPPACELEPRPAHPYGGAPTCTPLPTTSWSLSLEREIVAHDFGGYLFGSAVVAPGPTGRSLLFVQLSLDDDSHGHALVGLDATTEATAVWVPQIAYGRGGAPVFRGSAPGSDLFGSLTLSEGPRAILIDIEAGVAVRPAQEDWCDGPVARDLWHDGTPELVTGSFTYATDATTSTQHQDQIYTTAVAIVDSDGDGRDELLNASGWWDARDGSGSAWSGMEEDQGSCSWFMGGVVRWNDEVVFVGHNGESHYAAGRDGRALWFDPANDHDSARETFGYPAVGDIDGDGEPELCADLQGTTTFARDLDGTVLWQRTTGDDSYLANSTAMADLDADGVYEVLIWGEQGLWILNGADGEVLARWTEGVNWS